jgi:hypothetical protein
MSGSLLGGTINGSVVDSIDDVMRSHAVHCAAHRLGRSKNLLHHACKKKKKLTKEIRIYNTASCSQFADP